MYPNSCSIMCQRNRLKSLNSGAWHHPLHQNIHEVLSPGHKCCTWASATATKHPPATIQQSSSAHCTSIQVQQHTQKRRPQLLVVLHALCAWGRVPLRLGVLRVAHPARQHIHLHTGKGVAARTHLSD
jgi:hypothetical protein